jgi:hypothetical protein
MTEGAPKVYTVTFTERMSVTRRVEITAFDEEEAIDTIVAGIPLIERVILKVSSGNYSNFKVKVSDGSTNREANRKRYS